VKKEGGAKTRGRGSNYILEKGGEGRRALGKKFLLGGGRRWFVSTHFKSAYLFAFQFGKRRVKKKTTFVCGDLPGKKGRKPGLRKGRQTATSLFLKKRKALALFEERTT